MAKNTQPVLSSDIRQSQILQFDSNFESGNLDSVYLANQNNEYNLLCKTDTNTKGNTHWFYFKVQNWIPNQTATFNIMNVARDLTLFYNNGMQVWYRTESSNGIYRSDWQCSQNNVKVLSFQKNDIVRQKCFKKEYACGGYYYTLKFQCKFPQVEILKTQGQQWPGFPNEVITGDFDVDPNDKGAPGTVFCFAYALPYTYSDLLCDLEQSKKFLLAHDGIIVNHQNKAENSLMQTPKHKSYLHNRNNDKEEQKVLTKNQIKSLELKRQAIQLAKKKMGKYEMQLLKEDKEANSTLNESEKETKGCKNLEIKSKYLYYKQEIVSQSVGGLNIYQLTIKKRTGYRKKKCMYISARMHSAETYGSFIMKFILRELVTKPQNYDQILSKYVIKLVPMINPDGVTLGNSRSSLVGVDLNRRWAEPNASIHPEIYFLKRIMQKQADSSQRIQIFCDLHGHNRNFNCFFYGCNKAADEGLLSWTKTRLLPKIFASIEQIFDYSSCLFKQDNEKLNSARVVVWNEMKVTNSFTLETSQFCKTSVKEQIKIDDEHFSNDESKNKQKIQYTQLTITDLHQIAKSFLISTSWYSNLEKQVELECKKSLGWFKPSKLYEITGESVRDKQKRELTNDSFRDRQKYEITSESFRDRYKPVFYPNKIQKSRYDDSVLETSNTCGSIKEQIRRQPYKKLSTKTVLQYQLGNTSSNNKVTIRNSMDFNQDIRKTLSDSTSLSLKKPSSTKIQQKNNTNIATIAKNKRIKIISPVFDSQKQFQTEKNKNSKCIKIKSINQNNNALLHDGQVTLTSLKSWNQLFDFSEFQQVNAQIKQKQHEIKNKINRGMSQLPQDERQNEESDSQPSVDNLKLYELEENLKAALDPKQVEKYPFLTPIEEIAQDNTVQRQKQSSSQIYNKEDIEIQGNRLIPKPTHKQTISAIPKSSLKPKSYMFKLTQTDQVNRDDTVNVKVLPRLKLQDLIKKSYESNSKKHSDHQKNKIVDQEKPQLQNFYQEAFNQNSQVQMKSNARQHANCDFKHAMPFKTMNERSVNPVQLTKIRSRMKSNQIQVNAASFSIQGQSLVQPFRKKHKAAQNQVCLSPQKMTTPRQKQQKNFVVRKAFLSPQHKKQNYVAQAQNHMPPNFYLISNDRHKISNSNPELFFRHNIK